MFSWDDYLNYAKQIAAGSPLTEAHYRISVSRAYYSVFNKCSTKFYTETGESKRKSDSHKFIIDKFKEGNKEARSIGCHLETLKVSRIDSDYDASKSVDKKKMDEAIRLADIINSKLTAITSDNFN